MRYPMSDIHAHTLFGVDDGASSLTVSMQLLVRAYREGIADVVCASHSWGDNDSYWKNFELLEHTVKKHGLYIRIYPGCEAHCKRKGIGKFIEGVKDGTIRTINEGHCLLTEYSPDARTEKILLCSKMIYQQTGKEVVVAHVERCRNLEKNMDAFDELQSMGCLLQMNAYSLVNETREETKSSPEGCSPEGRMMNLYESRQIPFFSRLANARRMVYNAV